MSEAWSSRQVTGRTILALAAMLVAGFALRAWVAARAFCSTFDTGTVGLMAVNILQKGERPLFFYGQNYFGGFEAYLAALMFALFGVSEFTLSLSPILFSLGWIGAMFLVFRELYGVRAGLAAALVTAVPSWEILWYGVGTYGGYPAAFFWGTLCLWLCLRIASGTLRPTAVWFYAQALGLFAGVALWTHFIAAAWLLPGGLVLAAHVARGRFSWRRWFPLAAAVPAFLLGVWPVLACAGIDRAGANVAVFHFARADLWSNAVGLFHRPLRSHLFSGWASPLLRGAVLAMLGASAALYAVRLGQARRGAREFGRLMFPGLCAALFLALYLPHAMAAVKAARYVIPLWAPGLAALVATPLASPRRRVRRAALALLGAWTLHYAAAAVTQIRDRAPQRAARMEDRQDVVARARAAGLHTVMLAGGEVFGHQGQMLSFTSRGDPAFVSVYDERYRPHAEQAETDPSTGFATLRGRADALSNALRDVGVEFRQTRTSWLTLFHDLHGVPAGGEAVDPAMMRVTLQRTAPGHAEALIDRRADTHIEGPCSGDSGFTVDFGRERTIDRVWMIAPDPAQDALPQDFAVEGAATTGEYRPLRPPAPRMAAVYVAGNRAWVNGYHALLECRFAPAAVRRLRVRMIAGAGAYSHRWQVAEFFAFEAGTAGTPTAASAAEVDAIAAALRERHVEFAACDRWLGAQLRQRHPAAKGGTATYPRYNPKFPDTAVSRTLRPAAGIAVVPARPAASDCERVLRAVCGDAVAWDRLDFEHYSALLFTRPPPAPPRAQPVLHWQGQTLLRAPPDAR